MPRCHGEAQRGPHMGQHAVGAHEATSPARQLGLKQRTCSGPGPLHVPGALSHCSTAKPVELNFTALCLSRPTLWSGAQQYPQQVASTLSLNGSGHSYSPHSMLEQGGSNLLL